MTGNTTNTIHFAEYLIAFFNSKGSYISHLKLQKLLYLIQGWSFAYFATDVYGEQPEAWVHGPVYPSIYHAFKQNGYNPLFIKEPSEGISRDDLETYKSKLSFDASQHEFLNDFLAHYGQMDGFQLEMLTHSQVPWIEARKDLAPHQIGTETITKESMSSYFSSLLK